MFSLLEQIFSSQEKIFSPFGTAQHYFLKICQIYFAIFLPNGIILLLPPSANTNPDPTV
jgi:hypothetical protein